MKISKTTIEEITSFIGRESFELKAKLKHEDSNKVVVAIPDWLFSIFKYYYNINVSGLPELEGSLSYFYGCRIQPHFKDEVVVFYQDYHLDPKLFEPKIYTINQ